ncbi:hypothetical protein AGMMS49991_05530 [Spirochaetia bacterium]|nr:hypothetical protein AGMMS49991_05530 [Spirochaetia bacterium]
MKTTKKWNKMFLLAMLGKAMVIAVLAFGLVLVGCDDGGGGSKPALLAANATYAQAMAKLDEIIAYSGTPANIKEWAELNKTDLSSGPQYESGWSTVGASIVAGINGKIADIP